MPSFPTYRAIFYDMSKPETKEYAISKTITRQNFENLNDGFVGKSLTFLEGNFLIIKTATFEIINSIDNNCFVICWCKKM